MTAALKNIVRAESYVSAADLRTKQWYCVELTAANTVNVCNAATDRCIGVLNNNPNTGHAATVNMLGRTPAVSDGSGTAIAAGDYVGPNSSGKVVKKETADYRTIGLAMQASAADGVIIEVELFGGPGAFRTAGG